jgi:hypothetical protein
MINWFPPRLEDNLLVIYFIEKKLQQNIGFARSVLNFIFKKPDGAGAIARPFGDKNYISTLDQRLYGKLLLQEQLRELEQENLTLRAEVDALRASSSWRITAPIRGLKTALARVLKNTGL